MTPDQQAAEHKLLNTKILNIGFELIQTNNDLQRVATLLSEIDPQLETKIAKRLERLKRIVYSEKSN